MKIEYEVRFLEINKDSLVKKLKSIGAIEVGDWFQIRKTFDLIIPQQNSWIRLRTNGEITTLTVKEINSAKIDGTNADKYFIYILRFIFKKKKYILEKGKWKW